MRIVLLLALVLATLVPGAPRAEPGAEIRRVIENQIEAFRRDDLSAAWRHASPGIQGKFGDAETFGRMVARGYPMIRAPGRYAMGDLAEGPRGPVQTVRFLDAEGVWWEADYSMTRVDGAWRISGVRLRRLPGLSS